MNRFDKNFLCNEIIRIIYIEKYHWFWKKIAISLIFLHNFFFFYLFLLSICPYFHNLILRLNIIVGLTRYM